MHRSRTGGLTADQKALYKTGEVTMSTILIILLVLILLAAIPTWPYSRKWGYGPSGIIGLLLLILIVMAVTGRL